MKPVFYLILGIIGLLTIILIIKLFKNNNNSNEPEPNNPDSKESFGVPYIKSDGPKSRAFKDACKQYHLALYWNCVRQNGGRDVNGNCWARTEPRLVNCNFNNF
jgi:hypothetical protein